MEIMEGSPLGRRILENYSRNPRGWSFVLSASKSGFFDALVSGPSETWMLKIDSIFKPIPVVLGSSVEALSKPDSTPFSYGYRTLSPELVFQMLKGEGMESQDQRTARLLSVLNSEPVVPQEGRSYAQGPIVYTDTQRMVLSESQRKLDDKLTSEMRQVLRSKYPAYG